MHPYPAIFKREKNAILATVPDIPEVATNGYSEEQALEYAADAIELVLTEYMRRKRDIPAPSRPKPNMRLVHLSALSQAKIALYIALKASGIRKADLARRLGWRKSQVERLFDLSHASRMDQLEAAFDALGKRLLIDVANAA